MSKITNKNYIFRENYMPFPDASRIIYDKNPLTNVICQFRFPPILKIDTEIPTAFQEKIREIFPLYIEKNEITPLLLPAKSSEVLPQLMIKAASGKNYEFTTEDEIIKVNLTKTFISLSTSKYERWETFYDKLQKIITALIDVYSPPFFTRIGLRYIEIFNRSILGMNDVDWSELIKPQFLGLLSSEIKQNINNFESIYEIKLADGKSMVRIATSIVQELINNEKCYMVDSDFYHTKRISPSEYDGTLDFLHQRATRLIRYIIKEKLHNAMEPKEI